MDLSSTKAPDAFKGQLDISVLEAFDEISHLIEEGEDAIELRTILQGIGVVIIILIIIIIALIT